MQRVFAFLALLAIVSLVPSLDIGATLETVQVDYHFWNISGSDLQTFYNHEEAIQAIAVGGNDYALRRFLEVSNKTDGAHGYSHFNLMVDCLRKVGDERFALVVSQMDPQTKTRVWHFLQGIGDLTKSAPLTYATIGVKELPDLTALPLSDPHLMWP